MIRLYWVVQHPTGRWILRDDVVEVLGFDTHRQVSKVRFADGFGETEIPASVIVQAVRLEASA